MPDLHLIHSTIDTREAALELARSLVNENLVACVNIGENVTSVYPWEGQLHEDREVTLTMKTTPERLDAAIDRLEAVHPYDCPEILVTDVSRASEDYRDWVRDHCG